MYHYGYSDTLVKKNENKYNVQKYEEPETSVLLTLYEMGNDMFKIDMHVHSVLGGDSMIQPEEVVSCAKKAGLDGVCITEHHDYAISHPFDEIRQKTGFPIFRAMEYKAKEGHLLVFGVNMGKADMLPQIPMQQVIDWVVQRGGAAVPAHPYQEDMFGRSLGDRLLSLKQVTAVEGVNGSATRKENQLAAAAAEKMDWHAIGGSDAHGPAGIGKAFTVFLEKIETDIQLVDALKSGAYYPMPKL